MTKLIPYEPETAENDDHDELGRPLRIVSRIRNNRLIRAREQLGYTSCREAAEKIGVDYGLLSAYEGLRNSPWSEKEGDWKESAKAVAAGYAYHPEELWPEVIERVRARVVSREVGAAAVRELTAPQVEEVALKSLRQAVGEQLATLSAREREVLEKRFGLGQEDPVTLARLGEELDLSSERTRQIEIQALKKLRQPGRRKLLEPFYEGEPQWAQWTSRNAPDELSSTETSEVVEITCPACARVVPFINAHNPRIITETIEHRKRPLKTRRWTCNRVKATL